MEDLFGSWRRPAQFVIVSFGIFASFLVPSIVHPMLDLDFGLNQSSVYALLQFLAVSLFRLPNLLRLVLSKRPLSIPLRFHLLLALVLVVSMVLDNFAALRLSHSTELLFKAPKLIPVMVGNFVFLKRSLRAPEIAVACVLVVGFVGVAICDFSGPSDYCLSGIVAVFASLTFGAVAANIEEYLITDRRATSAELMSIVFPIGSIIALLIAAGSGQLVSAARAVAAEPRVVPYLAAHALFGAIGLHFVFLSLALFGSIQTVLFTSTRKAVTAIAQMMITGAVRATAWYRGSIVLIVAGISANVYDQCTKQKKPIGFTPDPIGDSL
jgi:adenosine 3'-phospho 5'-phosphosulfate transporter B3